MTCDCGCSETPVVGRFLPGHDAKHYHAILDWLRANRPEVYLKAANEVRMQVWLTR